MGRIPTHLLNLNLLFERYGKAADQVPTPKANYVVEHEYSINGKMQHQGGPYVKKGDQVSCVAIELNGYPTLKIIGRDKRWNGDEHIEFTVPIKAYQPIEDFGLSYISRQPSLMDKISRKPSVSKEDNGPYSRRF